MIRKTLQRFIVLCVLSVLPTASLRADEKPSDEFVQMIVKLIGDSDREFRAAGLDQIRTSAKGAAATQTFAAQLKTLDAEHQIALLSALTDRGDVAARTAVVDLIASSKDESVRASAINSTTAIRAATSPRSDSALSSAIWCSASSFVNWAAKVCVAAGPFAEVRI